MRSERKGKERAKASVVFWGKGKSLKRPKEKRNWALRRKEASIV